MNYALETTFTALPLRYRLKKFVLQPFFDLYNAALRDVSGCMCMKSTLHIRTVKAANDCTLKILY